MSSDEYLVELEKLDRILSNTLKKNIIDQLKGTSRKMKIINNFDGKINDLPKGITIEIYTKDDEKICQMMQSK